MKNNQQHSSAVSITPRQPSRAFFSRHRHFRTVLNQCSLLFLLLLSSFGSAFAQGAITATWALSSSTTNTASVSGAGASTVAASTMAPGTTFSSGVYNTDGYKCQSSVNWPTAATSGYYLDFPLSPTTGNSLSVSALSFTIKISGSTGAMTVGLAYALDGGSFTTAGTVGTGTSNASYNLSLSSLGITCASGHTMVLRAYVYATASGVTSSRNVYVKNVIFTGTTSGGGGGTTPALSVGTSSLSFGSVVSGSNSAQQTYTLSGSNLSPASGSITITAPSGFQVSTTSGSGFASTASVSYSGAALAATTIYARFSPTAVQSYSGNITNAGGGATTQNVAVTGTGTSSSTPSGTAIYVSASGNDANAGTFAAPYKTITKGVSVAAAGDTIYVRGGTHTYTTTISISKSGTSSAKYYLLAYPGERPKLDFSGMAVGSSNRGLTLSGSYWVIKGFDFYKAGDNGMFVSGSNDKIEYCNFYENYDTGLQLGSGAANDSVVNCDSYFNADPDNGDADGFAAKLDIGTNIAFVGCRAWQNSDDGWDGYLRPADNVSWSMTNCWCFANGYLKSGAASSGNGNGFKMGGSDAADLRHDVVLTRCLSFYNRVKGFDQNHDKGSITLYNCTAYNNGTNYSVTEAVASGETLTVKNCVSAGSGGVSLHSSAVLQTNSWMSGFTVTNADFVSVDTTGVRGARQSDGSLPVLNFMRLATGSDLINTGTNVGLPYNGSAPDLGCFESNTGAKSANLLGSTSTATENSVVCYPNPVTGAATIRFSTVAAGATTVKIYDLTGKVVAIVFDGMVEAGSAHDVSFNGSVLSAGMYLCVMDNNGVRTSSRMSMVR